MIASQPMPVIDHHGCRLAYDVAGTGPRVLFIQGTGVHGAGWRPQIEALQSQFSCLSFDNRGVGRSQPVGAPVSVALMAADAVAVLDAAGWDDAHVVGHSLGGLVALEMALSASSRVRSLSLLCTFARGRDATRLTASMLWTGLRTRIGTRRQRRRAFLELVLPASAVNESNADRIAEELAPLFGHDLGDQPPIVMQQMRAMVRCDVTPRLGELAGLPTLVVSATGDRIAPPEFGRAIVAGVPGAAFRELDGAHGLPIHSADQVNAVLREHFAHASG